MVNIMKELIAVIEDEQDLLELLEYHLKKEGYDVFASLTVAPVQKLLQESSVSLIVADRNLEGMEGSEFVVRLRKSGNRTPVIFLTAKNTPTDIYEGFERGADDYITKPFDFKELILRIGAVIKRASRTTVTDIQYRDIVLKPKNRAAYIGEESVDLTKLEFDLLMELVVNRSVVLSREELLMRVWENSPDCQNKTVNVAIKRLKEKIDPERCKRYIKSVRGIGYTLC